MSQITAGREDALVRAMIEGRPLPLPVIDIHGHSGPCFDVQAPHRDPAGMIPVMDALGVAVCAISENGAWTADFVAANTQTAKAVRSFPGRFLGYAGADPHYPGLITRELKRCFDEFGFKMIKLHAYTHQYPLTGEKYEEVYNFAEERRAVILTHTWDSIPDCSVDRAAEAARRHPGVTWIWAHSGAADYTRALELAGDLPHVYLELSWSRVYKGLVEHFLQTLPAEKFLFGSDFSFVSLPQTIAKIVFADITEADKRKLLHDNSARILKSIGITVP